MKKFAKLDAPRQVRVNENDKPCGDKPLIHDSVKKRFAKVTNYRPPALRGLRFDLLAAGDKREVTGVSGLRN